MASDINKNSENHEKVPGGLDKLNPTKTETTAGRGNLMAVNAQKRLDEIPPLPDTPLPPGKKEKVIPPADALKKLGDIYSGISKKEKYEKMLREGAKPIKSTDDIFAALKIDPGEVTDKFKGQINVLLAQGFDTLVRGGTRPYDVRTSIDVTLSKSSDPEKATQISAWLKEKTMPAASNGALPAEASLSQLDVKNTDTSTGAKNLIGEITPERSEEMKALFKKERDAAVSKALELGKQWSYRNGDENYKRELLSAAQTAIKFHIMDMAKPPSMQDSLNDGLNELFGETGMENENERKSAVDSLMALSREKDAKDVEHGGSAETTKETKEALSNLAKAADEYHPAGGGAIMAGE